jgi:PTS system fructose-specific IIC component
MTIRDLLAAESINLNGTPAGKTEALNQCIDLMAKSGKIADVEKYRKGVFAREEEGTTGIGMGIAIPHCKSDAVTKAGLAAMVVKDGLTLNHSMVHLQRLFSLSLHQTQRIMCIFRCLASSLLC